MIHPISTLPLASRHRVSQISMHPTLPYLAVQSHDRSVEIFRVRTEEEIKKKRVRRNKRAKEKREKDRAQGKEKDEHDTELDGKEVVAGKVDLVDLFTPYLVIRASGKIRSFDFATETSTRGGVHVS